MRYNELPIGYRLELDMLEGEALARVESGRLEDPDERNRRLGLLTVDVCQAIESGELVPITGTDPWHYAGYEDNYLVTALPETLPGYTNGVSHSKIIYNESESMGRKRVIPLKNGYFYVNGYVVDRFYTSFCGDLEIDSETLAYARKLRQVLEVVPGIIFLGQNREMLQIPYDEPVSQTE